MTSMLIAGRTCVAGSARTVSPKVISGGIGKRPISTAKNATGRFLSRKLHQNVFSHSHHSIRSSGPTRNNSTFLLKRSLRSSHSSTCAGAHPKGVLKSTATTITSTVIKRSAATISGTGVSGAASEAAAAAGSKNVSSKPVAAWLFGTAGAVAVMVTVGGITRMTKSGLSMTDWKIQGSLPPSSEAEWETEFDRYKAFPEWQQRRSMTLEEFKYIFFWEYAHRMLGRALGVIYGIPLLYFAARGRIPPHIRGRVAALFALGGGQGLVGWWMVKSGLEDRSVDLNKGKEIRVSPYRLAAHLATAFATFSLLVHTGFQALNGPRPSSPSAAARALLDAGVLRHGSNLRIMAAGVCGIAFLTAVSGAFVAGNDAGHCYNHFPKMTEDDWLPEEILALQPMWRNFFENSATVQADHRALALTTTAAALGMFWFARRGAGGGLLWAALPSTPKTATTVTAGLVTAQASLGITTLLSCTPLHLAAAHQAGALTVLASSMWTAHSLRFARVPSTMPSAGPPPSSPQSSPSPLLNLPPIAPRTTVNPRGLDEVTSSAVPDMSSSDGGFGGGSSSRA